MVAGAVSLRKSHDIVILSFCNIAKGQAKYICLISIKQDQGVLPSSILKSFSPIKAGGTSYYRPKYLQYFY